MKKIINVLKIVWFVSAALLILLFIMRWNEKSVRLVFIYEWVMGILVPFLIPFMFNRTYLFTSKIMTKPKRFFLIYGCLMLIYLVIIFKSGYLDRTKDLPLAIRENYSVMNVEIQAISHSNTSQIITVGGEKYIIYKIFFKPLAENKTYQFVYLPNRKVVIDIIDENGNSLLIKD